MLKSSNGMRPHFPAVDSYCAFFTPDFLLFAVFFLQLLWIHREILWAKHSSSILYFEFEGRIQVSAFIF